MNARLPIGTILNNYGVRAVITGHDGGDYIAVIGHSTLTRIKGDDTDLWTVVQSEAAREVEALRRQVAELVANGVSMHKAADRAAKAERAAIVAWLRGNDWVSEGWLRQAADYIERGDHEVPR